jgi:small subunit ribosomal protein S20
MGGATVSSFGRQKSEGTAQNVMANIKSQKKRNITNAKRAERNKAVKSELKTRVKNATRSIGTETHDDDLKLAIKRLDKAASKGVIHPNQAARRKSRLMRKANETASA